MGSTVSMTQAVMTKSVTKGRERSDDVWGSGDLKMMRLPGIPENPSPNIQYYAVMKGISGFIKTDLNDIKEADDYLDSRCVTRL